MNTAEQQCAALKEENERMKDQLARLDTEARRRLNVLIKKDSKWSKLVDSVLEKDNEIERLKAEISKDQARIKHLETFLREVISRAQFMLPCTSEQIDWFEQGAHHKKCGDFLERIYSEWQALNPKDTTHG